MPIGEFPQIINGFSCQYCSGLNPRWVRNHNGFVVCLCRDCAARHAGTGDRYVSTLARRLTLGCMIPAALTHRSDWHERWKHVNAAAGALCGIAFNDSGDSAPNLQLVEDLLAEMEVAFERICLDLEESSINNSTLIWEQRLELFGGLRKRVSERLTLLLCEDVPGVERAMAAIKESRK